MKIKLRDDELGLVQVIHNGVEIEFAYEYDKVDQTRRITELSAVRANHFGILNRLELTLNGCEEYLDDDIINNPAHYQVLPGVEVIDVRRALINRMPTDTDLNAVDEWSRAWEYLTRMWGKGGLEDAKKARVYLDWLITRLEKNK